MVIHSVGIAIAIGIAVAVVVAAAVAVHHSQLEVLGHIPSGAVAVAGEADTVVVVVVEAFLRMAVSEGELGRNCCRRCCVWVADHIHRGRLMVRKGLELEVMHRMVQVPDFGSASTSEVEKNRNKVVVVVVSLEEVVEVHRMTSVLKQQPGSEEVLSGSRR